MGFLFYVQQFGIDDYKSCSISNLKKILNIKDSIIEHDSQLKASQIKYKYPDAFIEEFGNTIISPSNASRICNHESSLRTIQQRITEKNIFFKNVQKATSSWDYIKNTRHYFFYYYYPVRFCDVSHSSKEVRSLIYNFKDGTTHSKVLDIMKKKLCSTFDSSELSKMTFVCIPASTRSTNTSRYESFSNSLCSALNMKNAFRYITITKEKTQSHLGGTDNAEYCFDSSFFKNANVILFDDVVTRGHSMKFFEDALEEMGATVICSLSIGRTYSDYHGDNRLPDPWLEECNPKSIAIAFGNVLNF